MFNIGSLHPCYYSVSPQGSEAHRGLRPAVKKVCVFTQPFGCFFALSSNCSSVFSVRGWKSGHLFHALRAGHRVWLQKLVVHALLGPLSWFSFALAGDTALTSQTNLWLRQLILSLGKQRRASDLHLVIIWPNIRGWTASIFADFVLWSLFCFLFFQFSDEHKVSKDLFLPERNVRAFGIVVQRKSGPIGHYFCLCFGPAWR